MTKHHLPPIRSHDRGTQQPGECFQIRTLEVSQMVFSMLQKSVLVYLICPRLSVALGELWSSRKFWMLGFVSSETAGYPDHC